MKTEENSRLTYTNNNNSNHLSEEFISNINTLSDSIKEYYTVSKNTNKNINILFCSIENEIILKNNILKNTFSDKFKDSLLKLKYNIKSEENNLSSFFNDAKILFKRMRKLHQDTVEEKLVRQKSFLGQSSNNTTYSNRNLLGNNSEKNLKERKIFLDMGVKAKTVVKKNEKDNIIPIYNKKNINKDAKNIGYNNKYISEIEKLKELNKAYELKIKRLNFAIKKYQTELDNKNKNNNNNIQLKENALSLRNFQSMADINSSYKIDIQKIIEENNSLKKQNELNKNINNKFNNLIKQNNLLKVNITNITNNNKYLKKESDYLKNKINIIEKKLTEEKNDNNKETYNNMPISKKNTQDSENQVLIEKIKSIMINKNVQWDNIKDGISTIINNFTNENEQLKLIQKRFKETVQFIENHNKKNNEDKYSFNILKDNSNILIKKMNELIQEKIGKELIIYKFNMQIFELKENLEKLNDVKKINNELNNNPNISIKELNRKYEEQKQENNKLKEKIKIIETEREQYYKKLLSLGIKYTNLGKEDKNSHDQIFDELNNEIEQLKTRNESLDKLVEVFYSQFWNNNDGEKVKIDNDEIKVLKKENEKLINQIIRLSKNIPEEYNELQNQYNILEIKYNQLLLDKNKSNDIINNLNNKISNNLELKKVLTQMEEIKKENEIIKKKNISLIERLEQKEKETQKNKSNDNKIEDIKYSNSEEEFDLRKMGQIVKEKNKSQDLNIDYPNIQNLKDKNKELDFYYNALEGLVKNLLLTIHVNNKNKAYVNELCTIVGFDPETKTKILNNKKLNIY